MILTEYAAGCSRNNVLAVIQFTNVLANVSSTDASMALDIHVVT